MSLPNPEGSVFHDADISCSVSSLVARGGKFRRGEHGVQRGRARIAQNDKYLDADALSEDYYDSIYDGVLDDWYDAVYDGLFDDLYGKYYDGVLNEAPESVPYAQVSDVRSITYKALSDARSDWYSDLSDMRSDVYGLCTQIRSSIYNKDYDFTKDIERYQKKFAQFNDDQSAQ